MLQLEELSDNLQFLIREDIRSEEDLKQKWSEAGIERKAVQSELSSVRTRIYRSGISRQVRRWRELREMGSRSLEEDLELRKLEEEIMRTMPLEKAEAYQEKLEAQKSKCLDQLRSLKSRERLLAGIDHQLREMTKNPSNQDTGRKVKNRKPVDRQQSPVKEAPDRSEEKTKKEEVIR